ncbi:DUF1566 domain-containing protein [Leptospira yasudae]|uniref:Lcl C-terminal domain-containing protein n=2 Tax=Leptospira yasudae TaxID=2202201 RepID=A0ABX9M0C0_9LEPT|nr:hypothetical protein DLM77_15295 [Leptospira yasudae]TGK31407.1 DUF1566 domain-containing protein [Leptospira yasudae]TGM06712.1 DUF1566 domain-containing protein [Leptospira yasudae]
MKMIFNRFIMYKIVKILIVFFGFSLSVIALDGPFTDNANGTITSGSGLVWQKCSQGQGVTNCSIGAPITSNWASALSYCNGLTLDGRVWRLPNVKELISLVDRGRSANPIINTSFFPNTQGAFYWTSTSGISTGTSPNVATDSDPAVHIATTASNDNTYQIPRNTQYRKMAYIVDFRMGGVIEFLKSDSTTAYVRCVSGP